MNMLKSKFKKFILLWRKRIYSPEKYARFIGVNIGTDNLMGKNHWSSEPYLIKIGSHCQLTDCQMHTHGGGRWFASYTRILMFSGKLSSVIGYI